MKTKVELINKYKVLKKKFTDAFLWGKNAIESGSVAVQIYFRVCYEVCIAFKYVRQKRLYFCSVSNYPHLQY